MDLDALEESPTITSTTASRQKNCNSCVQAKRRCDRRTPICSRCNEKMISCSYTRTKALKQSVRQNVETLSHIEEPSFGSPPCSFFTPSVMLDVDYLGNIPMDSQPETTAIDHIHGHLMSTADDTNDSSMNPFIGVMDNDSTIAQDQWLTPMDQGSLNEHPSTPVNEEIVTAYQKMADFCVSLDFTTLCLRLSFLALKNSVLTFGPILKWNLARSISSHGISMTLKHRYTTLYPA